MKICIIGAGPAGLCLLKNLLDEKVFTSIVVYEQTSAIGGVWAYNENVGQDIRGVPVHAAMYRDLRTNLPKEVMCFTDLKYPDHLPSFIGHTDVLEYMEKYAEIFGLKRFIQFERKVVAVVRNDGQRNWSVTTVDVRNDSKHFKEEFDNIAVCSGKFWDAYIPTIEGLESFQGKVIHSRKYRTPEEYKDLVVMVVGSAFSATDISINIAPLAKKVYMSYRSAPHKSPLPETIQQVPRIVKVSHKTLHLINGETISNVDCIIFGTGYKYTFPFLEASAHPQVIGHKIKPLYKQVFHIDFGTSLLFLGLNGNNIPSLQISEQVRFVLAFLTERKTLPCKQEMNKELDDYYADKSNVIVTGNEPLTRINVPWEYYEELALLGGYETKPPVIQKIYKDVLFYLKENVQELRKYNYVILNNQEYSKVKIA